MAKNADAKPKPEKVLSNGERNPKRPHDPLAETIAKDPQESEIQGAREILVKITLNGGDQLIPDERILSLFRRVLELEFLLDPDSDDLSVEIISGALGEDRRFNIPKLLKDLRIQEGLSCREFAKKVGFSSGSISHWETGKRVPSDNVLKQIAKSLNIPPSYFFVQSSSVSDMIESVREVFPRVLKVLRLEKGASQNDFAREIGVSPSAYSSLELGKRSPSTREVVKIMDLLGITFDSISQISSREITNIIARGRREDLSGILLGVRKAKGMTGEELAQKIGSTRAMVSHWETGRRKPSDQMLLKIAEELGVPLDLFYNPPIIKSNKSSDDTA